jgi:hypothetical protein
MTMALAAQGACAMNSSVRPVVLPRLRQTTCLKFAAASASNGAPAKIGRRRADAERRCGGEPIGDADCAHHTHGRAVAVGQVFAPGSGTFEHAALDDAG